MRIVTTFLLALLLAPAALAQPCDPAQTDEACADTTDWRRYFPLEVGNIWHYHEDFYDEPSTHWSWTITGEAEVDGQTYFELARCDEAGDGSATCAAPVLLRYDDENALIARRTDSGETWWDELPCSMAADFNSELSCTGPAVDATTVAVPLGQYDASVAVPPDVVSGDTRKRFDWQFARGWEVFAGLGVTEFHYELQGEPTRLVYANVGGEQVGTPAFASCDPADVDPDVACPDTTDWRRYFPLAVGNEWQYRETFDVSDVRYWGWRVTGETEAAGRSYFELERCNEAEDGTVSCGAPQLVRYHNDYPLLVQYEEDGDTWWSGVPCRLDLPFNGFGGEEEYACEGPAEGEFFYVGAMGAYGAVVDAPPLMVSGDTKKVIDTPIFERITLYAGIGPIATEDEVHPEPTRLVYARIDDIEYGSPAFVFPTSGEPGTVPSALTAFTEAFPNPARGAMRAQYVLAEPQAVTLELIDLLGRRVRAAEVGPQPAGPHDVRLDLGGLRPGLYVLRLRGDAGAEATQRIVVVR